MKDGYHANKEVKKKPTRYYSKKQESKVAKKLGGKRVANSGATKFNKGDVLLPEWCIECKTKTSESKSFTIWKEWVEKNKEEAFAMGKDHSALCFDFGDSEQYYIISEKDFKNLVQYYRDEDGGYGGM